MQKSASQTINRSAAVRAVELKAAFHQEIMKAARVIAGPGAPITVEHVEAAVVHAAEGIVRFSSCRNEFQEHAEARVA